MIRDYRTMAPYFRNGLLYFPQETVQALLGSGLNRAIAEQLLLGLPLDQQGSLQELTDAVDQLLSQLDIDHPIFEALTSDESYFILTGVPSRIAS